jgi:ligand-binding sensor domain-containing protein
MNKSPYLIASLLLFLLAPGMKGQESTLYTRWENFTVSNGMPDDKVFSVAVDGENIWAGTENGLVLISKGKIQKVYKVEDGLPNRVVTGVVADKNTGDVWLATFGGLSRLSGGQFKNYTNLTSGLANDIVYGVNIQGEFVWAATTAGISRFNTRTGEWSLFTEKNAPLHEPWSYGIAVSETKVYVAVWGGGVLEYDIADGFWKPYNDPDGEMEIVLFRNQGLIHDIVSSVAYNEDTRMLWASTYFGLSGYDAHNWHNYLSTDSGLASDFINAAQSRGDEVWACTDKGLSVLNFKNGTWVTYRPAKEGAGGVVLLTGADNTHSQQETPTSLAHNFILNLAFQGDDIWVATAKGLSHGMRETQKKEGKKHDHSTTSR